MTYDRAKALAYARAHWTLACTDGYVGVASAPGYKKVPKGTRFVRSDKKEPK